MLFYDDTVSFKMLVGFSKIIVVCLKMIVMPQSFPINILGKTILCHKSRFSSHFGDRTRERFWFVPKQLYFVSKRLSSLVSKPSYSSRKRRCFTRFSGHFLGDRRPFDHQQ